MSTLQLEGSNLETLLARVHDELGPQARILQAEKVRSGGLAGLFARERFEMTVDVPDQERGTGEDGAAEQGAGEADLPDEAPAPVASVFELIERVDDEERVSTESRSFTAILAALREQAVPPPRPDAAVRRASEPVSAAPREPVSASRPGEAPADAVAALRALGVPSRYLGRGEDAVAMALDGLRNLPVPPAVDSAPGAVTVVVGDVGPALPVAHGIALELGLDPGWVPVLGAVTPLGLPGRLRVTSAEQLADRHRAARESGLPLVVASCTGRVPVALPAPALVMAVVSATMKPADARARLAAIGHVDALAVVDAAASADPATVLELDVPIARLDGRPATRASWIALLAERLYR